MGLRRAYRRWRFKRRVRGFVKFFEILDKAVSDNHPRWQAKQFWREFCKSERFRKDFRKALPPILMKGLK